jgi:glucokinase
MSQRPYQLIADIGGTNARFGISSAKDPVPQAVAVLATSAYADIGSAVRAYLAQVNAELPRHMCAAIAGPVNSETIQMTNNSWSFSPGELRRDLGLESLKIINDFEAMAWGVSGISTHERVQIGGQPAAGGNLPIAVIGPGTGFGTALLLANGAERQVVATEGGHASLAPANQRELAITRWLMQQDIFCSREAVLSGAGLELLYRAISAIDGQQGLLAAPDIQKQAVASSEGPAREALEIFCAMLGTAAADQALCSGALGGVYIVGGIVPRFIPFLRASSFRQRFDSGQRPMSHYLQAIPVYVVTASSLGLRGAAIAGKSPP